MRLFFTRGSPTPAPPVFVLLAGMAVAFQQQPGNSTQELSVALMSHTVHTRTRETGIRLAIRASAASVSSLILGQATRIVLIGLAMVCHSL
jgi:hypothetical protein